LAFSGDAGVRLIVSKNISFNLAGGIILGKKDYLDDVQSGNNNDWLYTVTAGLSYYFGRAKDSDGDGVPDSRDMCPNTPLGVKVDENGCPLDSDGDGVPDYLDKCPNTPLGVQVDADGCPIKKETVVIVQPAEIESVVLSGDANFEFNKSTLLPNAYAVLDSLVSTMMKHPNYKWEIGGYTDKIGSVNYNIKLSDRRAQAVVDYLVSKGVKNNNLKAVGYGKANPIATNETPEGRAMNRRVEIKVISKDNR
jgi:OOP family OmpA-OmpF porin